MASWVMMECVASGEDESPPSVLTVAGLTGLMGASWSGMRVALGIRFVCLAF